MAGGHIHAHRVQVDAARETRFIDDGLWMGSLIVVVIGVCAHIQLAQLRADLYAHVENLFRDGGAQHVSPSTDIHRQNAHGGCECI